MFGSQSVFRKGRESPPSDYNDDSTLLQCIFYSIAVVVFFAFMCFNVRTCMCVCKLKGTCVPCLHVCTNNNADSSNRLDAVLAAHGIRTTSKPIYLHICVQQRATNNRQTYVYVLHNLQTLIKCCLFKPLQNVLMPASTYMVYLHGPPFHFPVVIRVEQAIRASFMQQARLTNLSLARSHLHGLKEC